MIDGRSSILPYRYLIVCINIIIFENALRLNFYTYLWCFLTTYYLLFYILFLIVIFYGSIYTILFLLKYHYYDVNTH